MSLLVKDFIQKRNKTGDLGLELEVESKHSLPNLSSELWTTKREGSLRGIAAEYTSPRPLSLSQASTAIAQIVRELSKTQYEVIKDSPRTSFHVHKNVLTYTPTQYWTAVVAYWLVENLLFKYCSPARKGNHFCLRLSDAEGTLKYCLSDLRAKIPFYSLSTDHIRYAGLNLAATMKFGSLEFRGMDGHIDTTRFNTWTTELYNLTTKALIYKDPQALMDAYFKMDPKEFLLTLFSQDFVQDTLSKVKDWQGFLEDNQGSLCEIAYFHNWSKWEVRVNKEFKGSVRPSLPEYDYDSPPLVTATIGESRSSTRVSEALRRLEEIRSSVVYSVETPANITTGSSGTSTTRF